MGPISSREGSWPLTFDSTKGFPGEGPTQSCWVVTVNVSGFGSLIRLLDSFPDLPNVFAILVQETKIDPSDLARARKACLEGFTVAGPHVLSQGPPADIVRAGPRCCGDRKLRPAASLSFTLKDGRCPSFCRSRT